jgi:hypothetical protein
MKISGLKTLFYSWGLFGAYSHYGMSIYCTAAKISLWFYKPLKAPTQPQNV